MRFYGRNSPAARKRDYKAIWMGRIRKENIEKAAVKIDAGGAVYESSQPGFNSLTFESRHYKSPLKDKTQELLYNNQLVTFNLNNKYLAGPEQIWLLESIIGKQAIQKTLTAKRIIDNPFIESFFKKAPFSFYLSADRAYLVSSDDELTQIDFGPLTEISALAALQQFGIAALERAKEKTVVRL